MNFVTKSIEIQASGINLEYSNTTLHYIPKNVSFSLYIHVHKPCRKSGFPHFNIFLLKEKREKKYMNVS